LEKDVPKLRNPMNSTKGSDAQDTYKRISNFDKGNVKGRNPLKDLGADVSIEQYKKYIPFI
jgi:hypothetical protein